MKTTPSRILIPALTLAATTLLIAQAAPPVPPGPGAPPTRQPAPPTPPTPAPSVPAPSPEIIPPSTTPAVPAVPEQPLVPPTITPPVAPPATTPTTPPPVEPPGTLLPLAPVTPATAQLKLPAQPPSIGLGVVTGTRVSARGKATVHSQLVFRFGQNEPVNILEEITLAVPKAGEPRKWYRVQVPQDAGLWVHHQFLQNQRIVNIAGSDGNPSPHTFASVKANRLNVRGGAGEIFPILGRLPQGTDVALTGAQKGKWLEIFAPSNCSVFVASQYVKRAHGSVANITGVQPVPGIQPQPGIIQPLQPGTIAPVQPGAQPVVPAQPGTVAPVQPGATPAVPPETTVTIDPNTFGNPNGGTTPGGVAVVPKPAKPITPTVPKPTAPTEPVKVAKANPNLPPPSKPVVDKNGAPIRIVTREGIVHRTLSLSAPSRYVLEHLESGKTINFLITQHPALEKEMEKLLGRRILVSGQEAMDARNQHTPVLIIKSLKTTDDLKK